MQSENDILLLFYIFLIHAGNEEKPPLKCVFLKGVGCEKGGCCVLSSSTCAGNK
jgi:hypothetical protein